jgi:hypothetical protein
VSHPLSSGQSTVVYRTHSDKCHRRRKEASCRRYITTPQPPPVLQHRPQSEWAKEQMEPQPQLKVGVAKMHGVYPDHSNWDKGQHGNEAALAEPQNSVQGRSRSTSSAEASASSLRSSFGLAQSLVRNMGLRNGSECRIAWAR